MSTAPRCRSSLSPRRCTATRFVNADGTRHLHAGMRTTSVSDSFTYRVSDGSLDSLSISDCYSVTITPVNDAPVAVDDSATTPEDTEVVMQVRWPTIPMSTAAPCRSSRSDCTAARQRSHERRRDRDLHARMRTTSVRRQLHLPCRTTAQADLGNVATVSLTDRRRSMMRLWPSTISPPALRKTPRVLLKVLVVNDTDVDSSHAVGCFSHSRRCTATQCVNADGTRHLHAGRRPTSVSTPLPTTPAMAQAHVG
jgi:hypothetical protein